MHELAFSPACERNKAPIVTFLETALVHRDSVLEIGSGTGQHAVHFAARLPHLTWRPTDIPPYLEPLRARIDAEGPPNCAAPVELDVRAAGWHAERVSAVYTANTFHIMSWACVEAFFSGVGRILAPDGILLVYGPFRYGGQYTSPSNAAFDARLRTRDADSGIRDFEAVDELAVAQGLTFTVDHAMPANNQLLVWERSPKAQVGCAR
jgi:SAM-dependent methyltransferase